MRELTSPVIERVKNKLTYPAADEGQKIRGIFSETALFKSYGVKNNKYVLTATSMAPLERFLKTGPFLVLLKSNGRLQATWHGKAASLVFQPYAFAFVVFRILSVTCSLAHESLAHAQQYFSASTPGLVLFILSVM